MPLFFTKQSCNRTTSMPEHMRDEITARWIDDNGKFELCTTCGNPEVYVIIGKGGKAEKAICARCGDDDPRIP